MNISTLAEMAAGAAGDRVAVGSRVGGLSYADLFLRAGAMARRIIESGAERVGLFDVNSAAVPITLFAAALAGRPYVPLSFRLADDRLRQQLERIAPAVVVAGGDGSVLDGVAGIECWARQDLLADLAGPDLAVADAVEISAGEEPVAVLLFTSGTTGDPKAAVLKHENLSAYVLSTVEFMASDPDEATLVSVPAYHIAGTSAVLTSVYSGRRIVYMEAFDPAEWVRRARDERITHAMVVPTMLGRILDVIEGHGDGLPALAHLSYGGGRMPRPVIERAMRLLPTTSFVNAYGLTETSSTIALLSPDDHREAFASSDPSVRARLSSVGRPLSTLELEIRDDTGRPVPAGVTGEIHVRGEQVSGEYVGRSALIEGGWFPTNDSGWLDSDGYLYIDGRLDDVIVRGGENLSPGEIEDVLAAHPDATDVAVVGVPDQEWGEKVVAAVVLRAGADPDEEGFRDLVRKALRSSRTPAHVAFLDELPYNETGKLLRRVLKADLAARYEK